MSMLRPILFIGVGGSGGKTLRSIKQALNRKLESARYEGGIPAAWQFLQIDTTYDGIAFPAPMLPQDEFHCVVPRGAGFNDILMSITDRGTLADQQSMLAGWGVQTSSSPIRTSPSQMRAIGRQVGVADSAETLKAIQNAIAKMSSPSALGEFGEVVNALGATPSPQPQAFIISSLAGGSGAGMFMDVAELLKRATAENWAQHAISFLYTAEVFSSIGGGRSEAAKNSLGVMNELIASKWVGISDRSELLYSKLGLASENSVFKREYGCKTNFLIGARNDRGVEISWGTDGVGMDEVFLTVGEALAGAISDDEISDFLTYYAFISVSGYKPALDMSGLAPESVNGDNSTLAAAGIGFGQMNLGVDRIVDYVADAMTRVQVERLLWPELDPMILRDGVSPGELIQEKSDLVWPRFLIDSGLDQRGSQNEIVDALLPGQLQDRIKQYVGGLIEKNATSAPMPIATFSRAVWSEWENESDEFLKILKSEMGSKAATWVPEIQEKLRNLVANELALNGFAVLSNLTERLEIELREYVIPELLHNHGELGNALSSFDMRAFDSRLVELADGLIGVGTHNGFFLESVNSTLRRVLEFKIEFYLTNLAASLIQDMLSFLIEPLKQRLLESRYSLQKQQNDRILPDGSRNVFPEFPIWGSGIVPDKYKPRSIERVLIDSAEYESTYEFYASKDSNGKPPFQQSVSSSLLGRRMDPIPNDVNIQTLVTVNSSWITRVRDAQAQMGDPASMADWKFQTELAELSENNRRWLRLRDSSFGKCTDISIRDFVLALGESPVTRAGRELKFINEFVAMLGMASPLTTLNSKASAHITSSKSIASSIVFAGTGYEANAFEILFRSSKIPFAMNSSVGQACVEVLKHHGHDPSAANFSTTWFDAGSNASTMFAVATHMDSLPAWAFESLTEPILEQVAQSKNSVQTWQQFWSGRRSRPLDEAIPFETEIRRSIVTGWFTARLFGLVEIDFDKKLMQQSVSESRSFLESEVATFLHRQGLAVENEDRQKVDAVQSSAAIFRAGRTVRVWNPTLQVPGWSGFPNPLLPTHPVDESHQNWVLPQLLVSAGIALAEFGKSGDPEFINGYRLLKYLGREVTTTFNGRDHWDGSGAGDKLPTGAISQSTLIKEWIATGRKPDDSLHLLMPLQRKLDANPDRRTALIATVEGLRAHYTEIWAGFSSAAWHDIPETWELKEDIDLALSDIIEYVKVLQEFPSLMD
jgi:hypothetical protein